MLPRLEAEERLKGITDGMIAAGCMDRRERRKVLTAIEQMAGIETPKPAKAGPAMLAAMGIAVKGAPTPGGGMNG